MSILHPVAVPQQTWVAGNRVLHCLQCFGIRNRWQPFTPIDERLGITSEGRGPRADGETLKAVS